MKLPELMILPIFNEPADIPTDSGLDVEAFEEEEKKKHNDRCTQIESLLPQIKLKVIDLDQDVEAFRQQSLQLFGQRFELIVIGATNAGKSTFLHSTTKMHGFFNISALRETANLWRFKLDTSNNSDNPPFTFVEIDQND